MNITCFKAYDIRGKVPEQLNEDIAYRIGRGFSKFLQARRVVVGRDVRNSGQPLCSALCKGLLDEGTDVFDIGICGTEEIYFATAHFKMDGGIVVTASHNPADFNGMKLVREDAKPISGDTGLFKIKEWAEGDLGAAKASKGELKTLDHRPDYIKHLLNYIDINSLKPLRIVVNPGNGCAGPVISKLESYLPFEFIKVHFEPDGSFPNGIPNPLLPEKRAVTREKVLSEKADLGLAWDGDFDRCFFFDETGRFIEGYYIVGLLAEYFLEKEPGAKIIHDPRLTWNTIEIVQSLGGIPIESKTGHAFMKERMRRENAVYGGEMSAHHFFRDFYFCDSGMIPWLIITQLISKKGIPLFHMVEERMKKFPVSGEINRRLKDPQKAINKIEELYKKEALRVAYVDGLSMEMDKWRFNLRCSNTEPLLRLNVETKGDPKLLKEKTEELLEIIDSYA